MRRLLISATFGLALTLTSAFVPVSASAAVTAQSPIVVAGTDELDAVACPSSTTCFAVGNTGPGVADAVVVTITNGAVTAVRDVPADSSGYEAELDSISCVSATTCYAAGYAQYNGAGFGAYVSITNGVPSAPVDADYGIPLEYTAIACSQDGNCELVGGDGYHGWMQSITDGNLDNVPGWLVPQVSNFDAVTCMGSSDSCYAFAEGAGNDPNMYEVPINNTVAGTPVVVPGATRVEALGCAGQTFCLMFRATSQLGELYQFSDGTVTGPVVTPDYFESLACADPTDCVGVSGGYGDGYVTPIVDGTPAAPTMVTGVWGLSGVACSGSGACEAVGTSGSEGVALSFTLTMNSSTGTGAGAGSGSGTNPGPTAGGGSGSGTSGVPNPGGPGGAQSGTGGGSRSGAGTSGAGTSEAGTSDAGVTAGSGITPAANPHTSTVSRASVEIEQLSAKHAVVEVTIACVSSARCVGSVTETARARSRRNSSRRPRPATLARRLYSLALGTHRTIMLELGGAAQSTLTNNRDLEVEVTVETKGHDVISRPLTLKLS